MFPLRRESYITKFQAEKKSLAINAGSPVRRREADIYSYVLNILLSSWKPTTACKHPEKSWP
jgi:hypothetical protein